MYGLIFIFLVVAGLMVTGVLSAISERKRFHEHLKSWSIDSQRFYDDKESLL